MVFSKCAADKKFLQMVAQRGVLAVAEVSPIPPVTTVLAKYSASKNVNLAELAVRSLETMVKTMPPYMLVEP